MLDWRLLRIKILSSSYLRFPQGLLYRNHAACLWGMTDWRKKATEYMNVVSHHPLHHHCHHARHRTSQVGKGEEEGSVQTQPHSWNNFRITAWRKSRGPGMSSPCTEFLLCLYWKCRPPYKALLVPSFMYIYWSNSERRAFSQSSSNQWPSPPMGWHSFPTFENFPTPKWDLSSPLTRRELYLHSPQRDIGFGHCFDRERQDCNWKLHYIKHGNHAKCLKNKREV